MLLSFSFIFLILKNVVSKSFAEKSFPLEPKTDFSREMSTGKLIILSLEGM